KISVFVPMSRETGNEVRPVGLDANGGVIEIGTGQGIKGESGPIADQDEGKSEPLIAHRPPGEQEEEAIAEADLGERILEGPIGLGAVSGAKENAEQAQEEGPGESVKDHSALRLAAGAAAGEGKGEGDPDQKGK